MLWCRWVVHQLIINEWLELRSYTEGYIQWWMSKLPKLKVLTFGKTNEYTQVKWSRAKWFRHCLLDSLSNIGSLIRRILNHIVHYLHACSDTSVCDNGGTESRELGERYCQCFPGANGECMFSQENMPTVHPKAKERWLQWKTGERPAFVDSITTGMSTTNSWMNSKSLYVIYMDTQCCAALMLYEQQRRRWSAGHLEKLIYANDNHAVTRVD